MKKEESNIQTTEEFRKALQPTLNKIKAKETQLSGQRVTLRKFEMDRDSLDRKFKDAVLESSSDYDKLKSASPVVDLRGKLESIDVIIAQIRDEAIPSTIREINTLKAELTIEVQSLLANFKQLHRDRMNIKISEGLAIGIEFVDFAESILKELNLSNAIDYWQRETIVRIIPAIGDSLPQGYKRCLGIDNV